MAVFHLVWDGVLTWNRAIVNVNTRAESKSLSKFTFLVMILM